jgi:galactokinase
VIELELERRARMESAFRAHFGEASGARLARAPGRVNLIGEHIDYNDLPVLPMALQRDVALLFLPRADAVVRLANVDARFDPRGFEISRAIAPSARGDWGNYAKAAAQALARDLGLARGMDVVVSATLPAAAGLSSSAALVVGSALALLAANERELEPLALAELCADAERYVGTRSGGMDQAASLCGRPGHALRIEFAPLRVEPIAVPQGWSFVVAHSLVQADKSGAVRTAYNQRRAQCEEVLRRMARLPELAPAPARWPELLSRAPLGELAELAEEVLDNVLLARFRHVAFEAQRVDRACQALRRGSALAFGELMNASHASLERDFEASHPALDELAALARSAGARGARLTGAGFGGSIVALTEAEHAGALCEALRERFYARRPGLPGLDEPLLVASASAGASVAG